MRLFSRFVFLLLVLCLTLGTYRVCEEYFIKVALKESLVSYAAISSMMANYMLISSAVIIAVSVVLGRIIKRKHLSPIVMMMIHTVVSLIVAVACLLYGKLYLYVGFEIVKRTLERCFHIPSRQIIISCYVRRFRNKLRSVQNLYYYTIIPIPYALLFSLPAINQSPYQKQIVLAIIIVSLLSSLFYIVKFKNSFRNTLCKFALSLNKTTAVLAVQALSFLRPQKYEKFLADILKYSPKKILRKNIILSLAYSHEAGIDDIIINHKVH